MKHYKILMLLLLNIQTQNSLLYSTDHETVKDKIKNVVDNLRDKTHNAVDKADRYSRKAGNKLAYYRDACGQSLSDWAEAIKNKSEDFADFIIDEKDATFQSLSKAEQKAVRDINTFYHNLAHASDNKRKDLIQSFSKRWRQCKRILNQSADTAHDEMQDARDKMQQLTDKLHKSMYEAADWCEYYTHASEYDLHEWVNYYKEKARENGEDIQEMFEDFIQDEDSQAFQDLTRAQQKAIRELNKFLMDMSDAADAARDEADKKQDELIHKFSKKWNEYKKTFKTNN